eukprot:3494936-Amphidinium_carterae.2
MARCLANESSKGKQRGGANIAHVLVNLAQLRSAQLHSKPQCTEDELAAHSRMCCGRANKHPR